MPITREAHGNATSKYPLWVGLIFVFNLIVGTGALTLPSVFAKAGWLLGLVVIIFLAFMSYITVTFVIESMACANAIAHWTRMRFLSGTSEEDDDLISTHSFEQIQPAMDQHDGIDDEARQTVEHIPLFAHRSRYYSLDKRVELGEMAEVFFSHSGRYLFYLCLTIYLYGDLSIYSAAVSKSLRDIICGENNTFVNMTNDELDQQPCWIHADGAVDNFTRLDCYRASLIAFAVCIGPFVFFNIDKTKYIQMFTVLFRWLAFSIMISIAIRRLIVNGPEGNPPAANVYGLPSLFGTCIYSFMCHHSLPSLIAPIKDKERLHIQLSSDYILISFFYLFLALTGSFAFANLEDLYTLNFIPSADKSNIVLKLVEYFLALFPVFTLSASFPIIAITLRNNLKTLFLDTPQINEYDSLWSRCAFPLLAVLPPILVTYFTDSLTSLVSFTGSYAGAGIQYIIPIALVWQARRRSTELLGEGIVNDYKSPFKHVFWLIFVLVWSCFSIALVTINFLLSKPLGLHLHI